MPRLAGQSELPPEEFSELPYPKGTGPVGVQTDDDERRVLTRQMRGLWWGESQDELSASAVGSVDPDVPAPGHGDVEYAAGVPVDRQAAASAVEDGIVEHNAVLPASGRPWRRVSGLPHGQRLFAIVSMISSISNSSKPWPALDGKCSVMSQSSCMSLHGSSSGAKSTSRLADCSMRASWLPE